MKMDQKRSVKRNWVIFSECLVILKTFMSQQMTVGTKYLGRVYNIIEPCSSIFRNRECYKWAEDHKTRKIIQRENINDQTIPCVQAAGDSEKKDLTFNRKSLSTEPSWRAVKMWGLYNQLFEFSLKIKAWSASLAQWASKWPESSGLGLSLTEALCCVSPAFLSISSLSRNR